MSTIIDQPTIDAVNKSYGTGFKDINAIPKNYLHGALRDLLLELKSYKKVPNRDELQAQYDLLEAQKAGLIERWLGITNQMSTLWQAMHGPYEHPNYRGVEGQANLAFQRAIGEITFIMSPLDEKTGEPLDPTMQPVLDLHWSVINLLDGELDHSVYELEQLIEKHLPSDPTAEDKLRAQHAIELALEEAHIYQLNSLRTRLGLGPSTQLTKDDYRLAKILGVKYIDPNWTTEYKESLLEELSNSKMTQYDAEMSEARELLGLDN